MVKLNKKFRFTNDNVVVMSWVSLVLAGKYTYDQVPNLLNLRQCVKEVLDLEEVEQSE